MLGCVDGSRVLIGHYVMRQAQVYQGDRVGKGLHAYLAPGMSAVLLCKPGACVTALAVASFVRAEQQQGRLQIVEHVFESCYCPVSQACEQGGVAQGCLC